MKRIIYFFVFVGIIAVACSKETPVTEEQASTPGTYTYVINGTMDFDDPWGEEDPETKTSYTNDKTFKWSNGDQISVLFHKGTTNKFYTFTIVKGGSASGKFVCNDIEEGYTIGASDDGTKWALFPASEGHTYDKDASDKLSFSIPATTDFTNDGTHYSVNIPMEARGDANDNFTFKQLTSCYKFTFTNINANVSKVKLTVENTGSDYVLSGTSAVRVDEDGYYLPLKYGASGGSKIVSIIDNVSSGTAVFYIQYREWYALEATITLQNMTEGDHYGDIILKAQSTGTALTGIGAGKIARVPAIDVSSYGEGTPFWSTFGINWSSITCKANGDSGSDTDAIKIIKAAADASHVYVYLEILNDKLYSNTSYTYSDRSYLYIGDGSGETSSNWTQNCQTKVEGWLKYYGVPEFRNWSSYIEGDAVNAIIAGGIAYFEIAIKRSELSYLQAATASTAYVGFMVTSCYNTGGSTSGSKAEIGYAPAKDGSMLAVSIPAYVAP